MKFAEEKNYLYIYDACVVPIYQDDNEKEGKEEKEIYISIYLAIAYKNM